MAATLCYIYYLLSKPRSRPPYIRQQSKYKVRLPGIPHLVLTTDDIKAREIFVIGDVHGCLVELEELLKFAMIEAKDKTILPIFVGDLANKGPHSAATIKKIRQMDAYAVRGNHDEAVIKQCLNRLEDPDYILPDKYQWITEMDADDIDFLIELPYTISIPSKSALIVHGGIIPGIPLEEQKLTDFIIMRNLYRENEDGKLKSSELSFKGKAWASFWPGPEHVYFGHDAKRRLQQYPNATGLDTGCLYGGFLSGVFLNNNKIIQVKSKKAYVVP